MTRAARLHTLLAGLGLFAGTAALAEPGYTPVPREYVACTTCHGAELRGNAATQAPRLTGLSKWYVRDQLAAFRAGWRGTHPEDGQAYAMRTQALALSEDAIEGALRFVEATASTLPEPTVTGDASRGRALYATCAACHGARGEGDQALAAPALAGQSDWYLVRQLRHFAAGVRGYAPEDLRGAQMRAATSALVNDRAIIDVVAYINTLSNPDHPERNPP